MKKYMVVIRVDNEIGAKFFDSYDDNMMDYISECALLADYYEVYERVFDRDRGLNVYQLRRVYWEGYNG